MTFIVLFAAMIALAVLAPFYGADSRDLRDHPWERLRH
jgi:hypothetical protein